MGGVSRVGEALPQSVAVRAASVKPCPRPPASCVRPSVVVFTAGKKSRTGRGSGAQGKRRRERGEDDRAGKKQMEIVLWGLDLEPPGMGAGGRI